MLPLFSHPGDVDDTAAYRTRLPERWCPMVSLIGSTSARPHPTLTQSNLRYFVLDTSIYDTATASPTSFSVACFFDNSRRWQNVRVPGPNAVMLVTAKVAGRVNGT